MDNKFNTKQFAGGIVVGYGLAIVVGLAAQKMLNSYIKKASATVEVNRAEIVDEVLERLNEAAQDDTIDKQTFLQIFADECVWMDTIIHNTDF